MIKHRGDGKYLLPNKIATEIVNREMVSVTPGANYMSLARDEIVVEQHLALELPLDVSSSSSETKSADETDDASSL